MGIFGKIKSERSSTQVEELLTKPAEIIVIDTETTGLGSDDEVLSLSIIGRRGGVLFNDLIKPVGKKEWTEAAKVNGIRPKDVENKQTLSERFDELLPLFVAADCVVGYNLEYDLKMLRQSGFDIGDVATFDVMREWSNLHKGRKWPKLGELAEKYSYTFKAHDALEDARATLHCYYHVLEEKGRSLKFNIREKNWNGIVGLRSSACSNVDIVLLPPKDKTAKPHIGVGYANGKRILFEIQPEEREGYDNIRLFVGQRAKKVSVEHYGDYYTLEFRF